MHLVNILLGGVGISFNMDWCSKDNCQWSSVRNDPKVIVEDASTKEEHRGKPKYTLDFVLDFSDKGSLWIWKLKDQKVLRS